VADGEALMFRVLMVVAIAAFLTSTALVAQEPEPAGNPVVTDDGISIIIASSRSGKTLYAYSIYTGRWDGVPVNNPDKSRVVPIIGPGLGYVVLGKSVYAYSAARGQWAVVELPEIAVPKMSPAGRLRIDIGTKIYISSDSTGTWATVDLAADKGLQELR
jgi:hypothetical protein